MMSTNDDNFLRSAEKIQLAPIVMFLLRLTRYLKLSPSLFRIVTPAYRLKSTPK